MKKRLTAVILVVIMAFGLCTTALGVSIDDNEVFLKQRPRTCTLTSATMLLRRKAILDGDANWSTITDASVSKVAWARGLAWNFTYNGVNVSVLRRSSGWGGNSLADKKAYLISMLESHPEGVVAYNYSYPHAVLLTSYDAQADTFYCSDPATCCPTGVIPLAQCIIDGSGQDGKLKHIDQLWYVSSGVSQGAGTMPVPEDEGQDEISVAWISALDIDIDGTKTTFQSYVMTDDAGNETSYVDVRALAHALSGSARRFNVTVGPEILLFPGMDYPYDGCCSWEDVPPIVCGATAAVTYVNDQPCELDSIHVTDYNGASHAYYKLRDLGQALGFRVDWDAQRGTYIETDPV